MKYKILFHYGKDDWGPCYEIIRDTLFFTPDNRKAVEFSLKLARIFLKKELFLYHENIRRFKIVPYNE